MLHSYPNFTRWYLTTKGGYWTHRGELLTLAGEAQHEPMRTDSGAAAVDILIYTELNQNSIQHRGKIKYKDKMLNPSTRRRKCVAVLATSKVTTSSSKWLNSSFPNFGGDYSSSKVLNFLEAYHEALHSLKTPGMPQNSLNAPLPSSPKETGKTTMSTHPLSHKKQRQKKALWFKLKSHHWLSGSSVSKIASCCGFKPSWVLNLINLNKFTF